MDDTLRVVMVEPGKPAHQAEIGSDLDSLQRAVGGYIEIVNLGDRCLLVCNEEGKLRGLEGNRRLENGTVIAGPFFIVGDGGEDFRSLTEAEVNLFIQRFAQPEQISRQEVEADMGITFHSF